MADLSQRLEQLSPAKRALLERLARQGGAAPSAAPAVRPRGGAGPAPLSPGQERLWFLERMEARPGLYTVYAAYRLRGALDPAALGRALRALAARHEALRTVFPPADGDPVQAVRPEPRFPLASADLRRLPPEDRGPRAAVLLSAWLRARFDLEAGPPARALLARTGEEEWTLALAVHHAVSDGWSQRVLYRELGALYAAERAGEPAALPAPALQYADFAAWQREWLGGAEARAQLEWWRERLAGAPAALDLPADRPRPAAPGFRGARHAFRLPAGAARALGALARGEGATLFMALLAGFQLLLSRYADTEDVPVGTAVAARGREELEGVVGFFVNTVVLRGDLSGDPTFRELLRRVRATTLEAFARQEVPFDRVVEELAPERVPGRNPLFQVIFALQEGDGEALALPGVEASPLPVDAGTAKFDLGLSVTRRGDALDAEIVYALDRFDAATAERMAGHLCVLLERASARPDAPLSALSPVGPGERARLLASARGAPLPHPPGLRLHDLFACQAARAPDAVAVAWPGGETTYAELDARSAALASHLRGLGVGPEARVGVLAGRTPELAVAVLGVLRAGGAYVPLDPEHPAERLAWMLEDSGARVVMAGEGMEGRLSGFGGEVVEVGDDGGTTDTPEPDVTPSNLAYVVYTSGSTGRPKGVGVEHRSAVDLVLSGCATFGMGPDDVTPAMASFAFDIGVFEVLVPLASGGTVRLVPRERVLDAERLVEEVAEATTVHTVPALMRQLVGSGATFPRMRRAFVGGDAVPAELLGEMKRTFPAAEVWVLYGPTEATVICAGHRVDGTETRSLIGRPLGNAALYVCDAAGELSPDGVPGELWVGGPGVSRGYLGRPELTAERFVPDPFSGEPGARLYRTGDRVRRLAGGELEFLGRMDRQVKIRGFRIETGEVEAVLARAPGVRQAVVVAREDAPGERRLVAYVVGEGTAGLRAFLRESLPEPMVPSAFVVLDALPLTATGKTDLRALPAPEAMEAEEYTAPRTPTEEVLAAIWENVLGVARVGATDGFFDLGGHSLLATRVVARVRAAFGVELPLRAVFEAPALAALAERVDAAARDGGTAPPPLRPLPHRGDAVPSFAQERLWLIQRLDPETRAYHMPFAFHLSGGLDRASLRASLDALVERHESLRTVLPAVDGRPVQRVLPASPVELAEEELSGLPEGERLAAAEARARAEARRPFDLERGPLFRAALLGLAEDEHVLLLGLHHAVADGWSLGVIFRELGALYGAFARGEAPLPAAPGLRYADYAAWQREWLAGETLARQLAWWRERLAGAPPVLEIPADRPRPVARSGEGAAHLFPLPAGVGAALHALARREGATLYMALLAAFQALLAKYAGEEDVVVGTPVAGRTHAELEGLVGFFVNTLPLRTDLAGDPGFAGLLRRVRDTALGAFAHQDVPFEKLVEELAPERVPGRNPLFQVAFALQNVPGDTLELPGVAVSPLPAGSGTAKFDLALSVTQLGDALDAEISYATDLFDAATVERMAGHLCVLLERAAAHPDARLSEISPVGPGERARLLAAAHGPPLPHARHFLLHDLFTAQAARTPGAVAVAWPGGETTYAELDARSAALAWHLRHLGVGPEARVGVLAGRTPELAVAVLGVLRAGGAYVPLDPEHPAERLAWMLEDSGARVVVAGEGMEGRVSGFGVVVVSLDRQAPTPGPSPASRGGEHDATPSNLAYVVYTSGSTGRPKGVLVEHSSAVDLVLTGCATFGMGPDDVTPSMASSAFDIWVFEVLVPLASGGTVRLVPRERVLEVERLVEEVAEATTVHAVPALMRQLVGSGATFPRMRRAFVGGDAVPAELLGEMKRTFPAAEAWVLYGPTEATVICAGHRVDGSETRSLIGRPLGNAALYVCDAAGELSPDGVPGELWAGGPGVSRGYLGRPELTAEKFVPDPFSGEPGARLYRTGDRVRRLREGELEFLGRMDRQVKIRGVRIETGEVEAVLARAPGVRQAVVVAREDAPGERRLVAYVVGEGAAGLRAFLRERLPEPMVPSAFVVLDALPLTATGKIDVRALPAPEAVEAEEHTAPRTPGEEVLAEIWAGVLGVERVGVHDHFFERGGHSLLATRVVSRVREAFGVELPLRALFEHPTVAGLAAVLGEGERSDAPPLLPADRSRPLPLSFSQERLWFLERMEPGTPHHNVPAALRLRGPLDAGALERALEGVVRRHEALRTVFAETGGAPAQVVLPPARLLLPLHDLSALPGDRREDEVRRLAAEEGARPFDLERGPLFRARLARLDRGEHVLLLTLHHVVGDGWSFGVLHRETSRLYAAALRGEPSPLPPLPVQYADFAAWQRGWLRGETLERQVAYWRERLAGAPALLDLPTDRPRPPVQTHRAGIHRFAVPAATVAALKALARHEGATLFMVLQAAYATVLGRYAGAGDVVVGTPIAGRTRAETEGLVGFFLNMLALRTDLSGDPPFTELLARVREGTLGAYAHQDVPFERLLEELRVERTLRHAAVYQAVIVLHNNAAVPLELEGVEAAPLELHPPATVFDLGLGVIERPHGLDASVTYAAELFDPATIEAVASYLAAVLEEAAADPERRIGDLAPLLPSERRLLADAGTGAARELPRAPVHQLVRVGDAVAVEQEGAEALTYAELERRANGVAHALARLGVGPETRVGICLERSPEMIVAVLGTLRAGGVYVPLDPAYPADRLAYMLEDSGARVVVTERRLADALPPTKLLFIEDSGEADAPPAVVLDPDNAAYVIYTSGSTGRPKGVVVPHRALAHYAASAVELYGITPADRVLQFASLSFDTSAEEIFPALLGGACLVLRTEAMLAAFFDRVRACGVTVLDLPTAYWHELVAELERGAAEVPPCVRLVIVGGERVLPERVAAWRRLVGSSVRLVDTYGPTETTVVATLAELGGGAVSIGRPVPNGRVHVLDADLRPLPVGVRGELYVGGAGVARGYLGRPELTAERFLPDPFSGEPGARVYRTGDVARWRRDGELEYAGRADDQVKVRGFRVEPGEVEGVLLRHPGVREAVVVAREDEPGRTRLVAYVVPAGGADTAELRAHLKAELPEHMVPTAWVTLEALPRLPSGKTDRRALPAPEARAEAGYVAPRDEVEELLAAAWADLLRVDRVGAHDGFFELGGHSLLATRLVSRVRETLGVELPLRAVFEHPTVAGLAEAVRTLKGAGGPPILPADRSRPLPLSFAQERLWFLDRLEPVNAHHNLSVTLRLAGPLDAATLRRAFEALVGRHESLRTVFGTAGSEPVQVIHPPASFALEPEELSRLAGTERDAEVTRLALEEARRPVDLAAGPLLRVRLLRTGADEHVLLLMVHHAVSDAWSFGVLFRELSALYRAFARGEPSPLPEPALQYADFAVWQRAWLVGETLERQVAYWRGRLSDAPALLALPTDRPRPAVQTHRAGIHDFRVPPETAARLHALNRRAGATLFMALLAALAVVLRRWSGQDDVVVGTPIAGRTRGETEGMIGFFVNMLALRTDLSGDPSLGELLARVREATLGAYAHQDVPFERLLEELDTERSLSHPAVYQVALTLHNTVAEPLDLPGVSTTPLDARARSAAFDLALALREDPDGGITASAVYAADLFDAATVEAMAAYWTRVLEDAGADPARRLSEVTPLLDGERAQLLAWNPPARAFAPALVHGLVRVRDAVAVEQEGAEALTYAELERRANGVAHALLRMGVGPETRVGICLERSPEMIVAVLGTLRAGGVYVPLDPAYPADRLAYMLEDSGARVVVTGRRLADALPPTKLLFTEDSGEADAPPAVVLDPDNAAYVIYTSGSTGRPKGVVVPHRALAHYAAAAVELYGITPADRVLQFASLSFDTSAEEIFPALLGGARLVLRTEAMLGRFFDRVRAWGVTVLDLPTAYWHELVAELERGAAQVPPCVRLVIVGGERVLPERVAAWRRLVGSSVRLVDTYGPTETTVVATLAEVRGGTVSIGRPVPNGRAHVLDADLRLLPVGVRGELYVGGAGVARGYLGRPELTAERFLPDPFSGEPGARVYRTGDVARWRRDGELEYAGRADDQVKVRGYRVEPGEVEGVLLRHPGVREAVVVAREDEPGRARLVAYVVPAGRADAAQLRAHLKAELPEHMVPTAWVTLEALPRLPNGKVDRRALPAPEARVEAGYVAPRDPNEERLAEIWASVLGAARVGVHDGFFELGGHSLLATRVVSRIREQWGVEVPLRTVFEGPTVAELARLLPATVEAAPTEAIHAAAPSVEEELLGRLDELSDAEMERLLAELSPE